MRTWWCQTRMRCLQLHGFREIADSLNPPKNWSVSINRISKISGGFIQGSWSACKKRPALLVDTKQPRAVLYLSGAPGAIRTPDPQIRSLVLYPAELRAQMQFGIRLHCCLLAGDRQGSKCFISKKAAVPVVFQCCAVSTISTGTVAGVMATLSPQPQADVSFGLLKTNVDENLSVFTSIWEPSRNNTALGSIRIVTP